MKKATRKRAVAAPDAELYLKMFRVMALQRAVEDRMVSMYRQGEMLGARSSTRIRACPRRSARR